jgi:hypothetical protein
MIICTVSIEIKGSDCKIALILITGYYLYGKVYRKNLGGIAQIYKFQHWYYHSYEHSISEQSKYFRICHFIIQLMHTT